jgi:hypothetical protein
LVEHAEQRPPERSAEQPGTQEGRRDTIQDQRIDAQLSGSSEHGGRVGKGQGERPLWERDELYSRSTPVRETG